MLPESTTILIVGAGPTGLATAISLLKHGCRDLVIVDAVLQGENTSRALAIHAATLESLDTVDCADPLIQLGIKGKGLGMHTRSSRLLSVDFSSLSPYTKYPYVLILPQFITERVLEEHLKSLGVQVMRPHRAVALKASDNDDGLHVSFENGHTIKARYVIGADGVRSAIRQLTGIGFADPDGTPVDEGMVQMVLADVTFTPADPLLPTDEVAAIVSPDGFFLAIPLQKSFLPQTPIYDLKDTVYRIGFPVPLSSGPPPSSPPIAYLQEFIDKFAPTHLSSDPAVNPNPIRISNVIWSTRFRNYASIADQLFVRINENGITNNKTGGIVLLVGDAAHIHSPAGGLGMNLGIRDAISLGPAIAEHIKLSHPLPTASDIDPDKVLVDYASLRHARALTTIRLTKRIMYLANTVRSTAGCVNLQYWFLKLLGNIPAVSRILAWRLSGLGNR